MSSERAGTPTRGALDRDKAREVLISVVATQVTSDAALDALEACVVPDPRISRIEATLEWYDESAGEPWDDTHECAPEDRWRLYRDLHAILRGDQ